MLYQLIRKQWDHKYNVKQKLLGHSTRTGVKFVRLRHDPVQSLIKNYQVVTTYKIW